MVVQNFVITGMKIESMVEVGVLAVDEDKVMWALEELVVDEMIG